MITLMSSPLADNKRAEDLAARRQAALESIDRLRSELEAVRSARSENFDDDEHDPEGATMSQLWSQSSGLLEGAERYLVEIDAALVRLHTGGFGICLGCGRSIDPARLDARPTAALCIDCARRAG
jgi:DnaK suppressor protein